MSDIDTVRTLTDPTEQAKAAIALVDQLRAQMQEASEVRTAAVRRLYHEEGLRMQQIADRLGLSVQRVQQLVTGVGARSRSAAQSG